MLPVHVQSTADGYKKLTCINYQFIIHANQTYTGSDSLIFKNIP